MAKWLKEEVELLLELFAQNLGTQEIAEQLGKTRRSVQIYTNRRLGLSFNKDQTKDNRELVQCLTCDVQFEAFKKEGRKFCSSSCAASYNNERFPKRKKEVVERKKRIRSYLVKDILCKDCKQQLTRKTAKRCLICDVKNKWIKKGLLAEKGLLSHKSTREYIIHIHGPSCMECGWCKTNPHTGKIPIELEHIDGNSENNILTNLKLLCPSCHSLTPTYKGANAGNGRARRRERYAAGKSY